MKKFLALVLAVLLVVSFSVVAHAEPCTHPLHAPVGNEEATIISRNASGHTTQVTQLQECLGCGEVFTKVLRTTTAAHGPDIECIGNLGHNDNKATHSWLMHYLCCGYQFTSISSCSGPPCPDMMD